jgi:hypothetical protein
MKKSLFTFDAVVALLLTVGVGSSRAKNCQDLLDNNLYRCQFNSESSGPGEGCVQAVSPGSVSSKFDLVFGGVTFNGCSCKAKGSVDKPQFNASKEFVCINPFSNEAVTGTVSSNGKKIKAGFDALSTGDSAVLECELDPTCVD